MIDCSGFTENGEPKWWVPYFQESEQLLLNALEYSDGTHSLEDVAMALDKDEMQLWPGINTAIVTEILEFPQKKIIHVFLAAGDMNEVIRILPYIEKHGKKEGCEELSMIGRKGWERVMDKIYKLETKVYLSTEI
jgi:hypothetical protein